MSSAEKDDNVRVAVRCRPFTPKEVRNHRKVVVNVDELNGEIRVQVPNARHVADSERVFTFDTVFDFEAKQTDIYNQTARPIVESTLEGYNGTIFAYGQTGTGKTYTMEGEQTEPEKRGIVPNSFAHIFGHIAKCEGEVQFLVRVSYLELYNEEVHDLVGKNMAAKLEVRERTDIGVYVKDLSSFVVKNADEMDRLMNIGNKNRSFAATEMNDRSSRSHVIFTITVERSDLGSDNQQHVRMGKLHLVDLAGSERQSKTGSKGDRLKEAIKINLSLSTLGNVISALVDGQSTHIPYRNSQLTRLLQDSLGGNSKTVMIANIGPADYNCDETLNTLRYANRAKNIKNNAHINEDPKDAMLREFQKEIEILRKQLEEASGSEESGSGEEFEEVEGQPRRRRRKKSIQRMRRDSALSPRAVAAIQAEIEEQRAALLTKKGLAEEERDTVQLELQEREKNLVKAQEQHSLLERKLQDLESKVIVGGVNLLEQAEEQERLLEASAKELEERRKTEGRLRRNLAQKEVEKQDMEERYASLHEEVAGKTKKLKDVWKQFQQAKEEIADMREEFQQNNEEMLETIRALSREVKLQTLVMDCYIPDEFQELLQSHADWHEETGEWHIRGIAYAGNNMRKQSTPPPQSHILTYDTSKAYLTYQVGLREVHTLTPSLSGASVSGRPKGAKSKNTTGKATKPLKKKEEKDYPTTRGLISRQKHFA